MRKFNILYIALLGILSAGCVKKHKSTVGICNGLYVEIFNINPAGVDNAYLTDSLNFRLFVDHWDEEHESIRYICKSDSICIIKTDNASKNCRTVTLDNGLSTVLCDIDTISKKTYSLNQLKKERRFE